MKLSKLNIDDKKFPYGVVGVDGFTIVALSKNLESAKFRADEINRHMFGTNRDTLDYIIKEKFKNKSDNDLRNHIQNTDLNDDDQMAELKRRGKKWHWEGRQMVFDN